MVGLNALFLVLELILLVWMIRTDNVIGVLIVAVALIMNVHVWFRLAARRRR